MRIVPVLLLIACTEPSLASDRHSDLERWLDRWEALRECVVSLHGDSIAEGAAVAMLRGADCRGPLAHFTDHVPLDEESARHWRTIAVALGDPSPRARARAIAATDVELGAIRLALGQTPVAHPRKPLLRLSDGVRPTFEGVPVRPSPKVTFNGGFIRAPRDGAEVFGGPEVMWRSSRSISALTPAPGAGSIIAAHEGLDARVVLRRAKTAAYELWFSDDRGRTWRRRAAPEGIVVEVSDKVPKVRLDLLVRNGDQLYRHRIKHGNPEPEIVELGRASPLPPLACSHWGHFWYLRSYGVIHIAPREVLADALDAVGDRSIDCRRDRAIVLRHSPAIPDVIERCGSGCYEVFRSTSAVRGVATITEDQRWVYAAAIEGVLSVRIEGEAEQLWRLPTNGTLVALTVLERKPYFVLDEGSSYRVIPVP